ncbi:hypothetical protein [Haladaptatus salinisoli]|uniref:hypothetical protein n=1 Tax=Haladaptatus salinisoli TaxID=2884876 RepID=UPI001D09C50A|nr:hypothetical protein [Haladaptatus salinisoli]
MNVTRLWKPLAVYSGLAAVVTVGLVYVATHSGALVLGVAGFGLMLVVLGGAAPGAVSSAGAEHAESAGLGLMVEDMGLRPGSSDVPVRALLFLYGLGLFLWSLTVLLTLRSTLR